MNYTLCSVSIKFALKMGFDSRAYETSAVLSILTTTIIMENQNDFLKFNSQ